MSNARRPRLFWSLVAATAIYLMALPIAAVAAMMSPMAADSGLTAAVWVFIVAAVTLPFSLLLCPIVGWVAYWRKWDRTAWAAIAVPIICFLTGFAAMSI
jgi:hypothetical protein